jgi:multidrug efflux pump subunit AcrA (membrane-fusion protein)
MEALWNAIKSLTVWQAVILVVVLFGTAAGTYWFYTDAAQPEAQELAENQQVIPIRYGDIVNQVSTNGKLDFPERETVSFTVKGNIGALLVEEGQQISEGQELARLDQVALASLEQAIAQARVDLLDAQDALAELLEPPNPAQQELEWVTAEEKIADARFKVQQAEEALEETLNPELPTFRDMKAQKVHIADVQLQLQQLEEEREELLNPELPTAADIKAQEELIAEARLNLQRAVEERDELLSRNLLPDYDLKLAESYQGDIGAEKELADIQEALAELVPTEQQLVEATQARLQAQIALDEAKLALEDFKDTHGSRLTSRRQEKADLETILTGARNTLAALQAAYAKGAIGLRYNIRRWETYVESLEEELEEVRVGIVTEVEELETNVDAALVALAEADAKLAELAAGPDALELQTLEAKALAIIASQEVADRDLAELKPPEVDALELALLDARIALADATLSQAIADLADLREDQLVKPDQAAMELNLQQRELSGAALEEAFDDLDELLEDQLATPDPLEIALQEQQIVLAEATLAQAIQDLAEIEEERMTGPDPLEIALKEAEIASAGVKLRDAREQLDASVIHAPISGFVSLVNLEPGDAVELGTEVLEIVDPTVIEIDGIVDEIDVLSVQVGTPAQVTLDALPDRTLEGIVTEIDLEALNQQGVVSYPIRIRVDTPPDVKPKAGMSAIANIVLRAEWNVLLLPQQALYGSFDQPVVRVMTDLGVAEKPVSLGSSDDFWVAVYEGLAEGDRIILEAADINANQFSFRQFRRTTGGGGGRR